MTLVALLALAAGTFLFRIAGPVLGERLQLSERVEGLANDAATVLLVALVVTASLTQGHGFAGWARPGRGRGGGAARPAAGAVPGRGAGCRCDDRRATPAGGLLTRG